MVIQTKGDRIQDRPLQSMGTGIFTKALDDAVEEVDLAVHSMKDVPQLLDPMEAWAVLERRLPGDVLVGHDPSSTVVATGSIRRGPVAAPASRPHLGGVERQRRDAVGQKSTPGVAAFRGGRPRSARLLEGLEGVEHLDWMVQRLPKAASWWWLGAGRPEARGGAIGPP